uniref:SDR family NAD(P)-dependent oxidoreductase n=1 Tax=Siminovitchia fortis TaxID=254758 RepID=UPI0011A59B68
GKQEEVEELFKYGLESLGRVDIVVNNAGMNRDVSVDKMTGEEWEEVIDVKLRGSLLCREEGGKIMGEKE